MKYLLGAILIVSIAGQANAQVVMPEVHTTVRLSSTDTNRIQCGGPIKDVIASEEKGIMTKVVGNDLYVKYKVLMTADGQERYTNKTNDVYVICNGATYSLVIVPKQISGQTVRLSGITKNVEKNNELFRGKDIEEIFTSILKSAYLDDIPESFVVQNADAAVPVPYFKDLDIRKRRDIRVEGEGLVLHEYIIKTRRDVHLLEQDFLIKGFVDNPVFISVEPRQVPKGATSRLFIIEKSNS
jgi:conjugal transfer pilus assembly protein TraK